MQERTQCNYPENGTPLAVPAAMRWGIMLLSVVLAACNTPQGRTVTWTKPGAPPGEYARDDRICTAQADAAKKRMVGGRDAVLAHNRVLTSCMRARGWESVQG